MSDDIAEAASFYTRVCEEHDRAFPLRNILVATESYQAAEDKERFIADVREYLLTEATALVATARVTDREPIIGVRTTEGKDINDINEP